MRRRAAALIALAALPAGLALAARRREPALVGAEAGPAEIAPGVFCIGPRGRTQTNVYLVRAGGAWVLVDAGWAGDAERIAAAAHRLAGATPPVAILLTHAHPDHEGSARALAEAWGCPVLVHPAERAIAEGDVAAMEAAAGPLDRWAILPAMGLLGARRRAALVTRSSLAGLVGELGADGAVPGMDGWRWVPTPGHTPGHVSFVRDADRVALTGDALLTLEVNRLSGAVLGRQGLSGPPWYTTWNARAAASSIAAVADLRPVVVGPGHGRPLVGPGTADAVRAFAATVSRAESVAGDGTGRTSGPGGGPTEARVPSGGRA